MNSLSISDLHLTDSPRDEYRWLVFERIIELCDKLPHTIDVLFILGDLTEKKDYHSSRLVNRIVQSLLTVKQRAGIQRIVILRGNHDGIDPTMPYFAFLNHLPGVSFVIEPSEETILGQRILYLPHTRNAGEDWCSLSFEGYDFILVHATFKNALGENGNPLEGELSAAVFDRLKHCVVLAGDVHVPQKVGRVEYIGAPYPVRFGDTFTPRAVLFLDGERQGDISIRTLRKHVVDTDINLDALYDLQCDPGDQVKVRVRLHRNEYNKWNELRNTIRDICEAGQVDLHKTELIKDEEPTIKHTVQKAVGPSEIVQSFAQKHRLDEFTTQIGIELLP